MATSTVKTIAVVTPSNNTIIMRIWEGGRGWNVYMVNSDLNVTHALGRSFGNARIAEAFAREYINKHWAV